MAVDANELPQARTREFLRTRLFLRAALPCVKVMLEDDPATKKRFKGVNAVVQFVARNQPRAVGAYLWFEDGAVRVEQGFWDADGLGREPDITFTFASLEKLNDFFAGKTVLPGSAPGHACRYALAIWKKLIRFLDYPEEKELDVKIILDTIMSESAALSPAKPNAGSRKPAPSTPGRAWPAPD